MRVCVEEGGRTHLTPRDDVSSVRTPVEAKDSPEPRPEARHERLTVVIHDSHRLYEKRFVGAAAARGFRACMRGRLLQVISS